MKKQLRIALSDVHHTPKKPPQMRVCAPDWAADLVWTGTAWKEPETGAELVYDPDANGWCLLAVIRGG